MKKIKIAHILKYTLNSYFMCSSIAAEMLQVKLPLAMLKCAGRPSGELSFGLEIETGI